MRNLIQFTLAICGIVIGVADVVAAQKPNVVFILADDLGGVDLNCYGNEVYHTPHLDRLAQQGMRFTNAYAASSVCSPTRASILSGKYPARLDLTIWLNGRSPARAKLLDAPFAEYLPLEEITIAEALKEAGYATASVGKWHLGKEPYYPEKQGFDVNVAGTHSGSPAGGYHLPNRMNLPGARKGEYLTDKLTDAALEFISESREKLFFLYLPYHSVHTPIQGKPELVKQYREQKERTGKDFDPEYAAMLHSLDENVGRIMTRLDELKLSENTLVVFFSDNGGYHRVTSNAPLRAGKGYSYEGGHREPLIVRLPGVVRAGSVCDEPVTSTDFYPTILAAAGLPLRPRQHMDGVNLLPLLKDSQATLDRDALYWHYPHYSPQGGTPSGAIRGGDWKLIEFFEDGTLELYNLADDPSETKDRAAELPDTVKELHDKLLAWRKRVDAKLPSPNPNAGKPRQPAATLKIRPTETFAGLDVLSAVEVRKSESGYELASDQTGLALVRAEQPFSRTATFRTTIRPSVGFPSNGFLVFGAGKQDSELVKCGLLVGGNSVSVFEGAYPSKQATKASGPLSGGKAYEIEVAADLQTGIVTLQVGKHTVRHTLSRKIDAIRYYGHSVIRTRTSFGKIEVDGK
ncbi:MAG: hypothetical protein CMJ48_08880 [Planctomycetaceae bacterium]|nr:hypothetical protein [Planctomycetaceae bacterium]